MTDKGMVRWCDGVESGGARLGQDEEGLLRGRPLARLLAAHGPAAADSPPTPPPAPATTPRPPSFAVEGGFVEATLACLASSPPARQREVNAPAPLIFRNAVYSALRLISSAHSHHIQHFLPSWNQRAATTAWREALQSGWQGRRALQKRAWDRGG